MGEGNEHERKKKPRILLHSYRCSFFFFFKLAGYYRDKAKSTLARIPVIYRFGTPETRKPPTKLRLERDAALHGPQDFLDVGVIFCGLVRGDPAVFLARFVQYHLVRLHP